MQIAKESFILLILALIESGKETAARTGILILLHPVDGFKIDTKNVVVVEILFK